MSDFLVIQAARFGDLIQTKRLILSLMKKGAVHLLIDQSLKDLAHLIYPQAIIHILPFNKGLEAGNILKFSEVLEDLKKINFKKIYNCNFSRLTEIICRMFQQNDVNFYKPSHTSDGGILRSWQARIGLRLISMRKSTPLNLVDFWSWMIDDPIEPENVNPLAKMGGQGIGVVLAGRESRRSLPMPVLANIVQTVFKIFDKPAIKIFGLSSDIHLALQLLRNLPASIQNNTLNLCGKTNWQELIDNLAGLDLLLSPDTGTMHLAAHLGTPVMAFFLSSALCHETGPYGKGHFIWQSATSCGPCLETSPCKNNIECLNFFKEKKFLRYLMALLTDNKKILDNLTTNAIAGHSYESGLQCWQTELDNFGAKLVLKAGMDHYKSQREFIRSLLKNMRGLYNIYESTLYPEAQQEIIKKLDPVEEWMVSKYRYI